MAVRRVSIGVDFGTNSARALVADCENGEELGVCVVAYPGGEEGILTDPEDERVARQNPADYLFALEKSVCGALERAEAGGRFRRGMVIGIGIASTGSTILPVDERNVPLGMRAEWTGRLEAQSWLWKDHTGFAEARRFTEVARAIRPDFLGICGGAYSAESFWAKILHCANVAPDVFEAAVSWIELCDFVPAVLCGIERPEKIRRGICAAGHKALFDERWDGLPDEEFLREVDPEPGEIRGRLLGEVIDDLEIAGRLCGDWAERLGLKEGIPVAPGKLDVHAGAIGCGVGPGKMVKVIGTSACDCLVVEAEEYPEVSGISGVVKGSILPGFYGIEAGQTAVGDLFKWWVEVVGEKDAGDHGRLVSESERLFPGESGLLALDWNNGNRNILGNPLLSGLLVGQTLRTTRAEIYRALIEATAFGARMILERLREKVKVPETIVCAGGIAEKNRFLLQVYADVTGCEMQVAASGQAVALGAAICGSVAGIAGRQVSDFAEAQRRMVREPVACYRPELENAAVYDRLFGIYRDLHDGFGGVRRVDFGGMMERLQALRREVREKRRGAGFLGKSG